MNKPAETRPHIGQAEMLPAEEPTIAEAAEQALQPVGNQAVQVAEPHPLAMLQTALDAGHDVEKLGRLMDLADRYEANQARKAFAGALSDFQGTVPAIVETKLATVTMKSGGAYTYNYADLDTIMRAIRPTLQACGLSVRYDTEISEDGRKITSVCYVMHRDGHTEKTTFVCPVDEEMKVNDSQKMGSANSYASRYNVCNALGLTTGEDDDGGALAGEQTGTRSSATPAAPKADDLDQFFPIGKWKGKPWDQVPLDYLEWAAANLDDKPDVVAKCKEHIAARMDSDDQQAQAEAGAEGEMSMAECARGITNATHVDKLAELWGLVPDKHRDGLEAFYNTRRDELMGNDKRGPDQDDDAPF